MGNPLLALTKGFLLVLCATSMLWAADQTDRINLYIDCSDCASADFDFFRTEITFVNFVRDRSESDVHILVSMQNTGSGGKEYTLTFIGRGRFELLTDTLKHIAQQSDSDELIRNGLLKAMKMGLIRYVSRTAGSDQIAISYSLPEIQNASDQVKPVDKWNNWVFKISGNGYFQGEESYTSRSLYGTLSANRVTESLKLGLSIYGNHQKNEYDTDDRTISSSSSSKGLDTYAIFSLTDHWSWGAEINPWSSTYSNRDFALTSSVSLEYNIFPYGQSTHKQLRIMYDLRHYYMDYHDETIYGKTTENIISHSLQATLEIVQPWGSGEIAVEGSHFLKLIKRNRLAAWGEMSLRIVEGFSIELYGNVSRIRDQISLPKGDASDEDILLRMRQLETGYSYYTSIGLSYTFGSIYNNIVNPRFGG